MSVECTFNIGNAVVSLAGVTFGGLVGFLSARNISDRNALAAAAAKLRAAFAPSLMRLNLERINEASPDDIHHNNILKDELPKLAGAIEEFRPFVRKGNSGAYQEAWEHYYKTIKKGGVATVRAYNETDPWSVVEKKIQTILAFAKPNFPFLLA